MANDQQIPSLKYDIVLKRGPRRPATFCCCCCCCCSIIRARNIHHQKMRYPTFIIYQNWVFSFCSTVYRYYYYQAKQKRTSTLLGGFFPCIFIDHIIQGRTCCVWVLYTHTTGLCMTGNVRIFWRDWKMDWTLNSQTDRSQSKSEHIFLKKKNRHTTCFRSFWNA